jgi:hypothetical protein
MLISLPRSTEGRLFIYQTSDCQLIKMTFSELKTKCLVKVSSIQVETISFRLQNYVIMNFLTDTCHLVSLG